MPTNITDIIKPAYIAAYMEAVFPDILPFVGTGAAQMDFEITGKGGDFITVPSFVADKVRAEKNDGTKSPTIGKIQSYRDVAGISRRKRVRGVEDAAKDALGRDQYDAVNNAIAASEARYWAEELQYAAVSVAKGVFDATAGALKDSLLLPKGKTEGATVQPITTNLLIDAAALMGDNLFGIVGYVMHSKVWADFAKENQARIVAPSNSPLVFFDGKPIIVSDLVGKRGSGKYTIYQTYLIRPGAFWFGVDPNPEYFYEVQAEYPREILTSTFSIVTHIRGVKWAVQTTNPQNPDLETPANWAQCTVEGTSDKIDSKLIGIACLETNASGSV